MNKGKVKIYTWCCQWLAIIVTITENVATWPQVSSDGLQTTNYVTSFFMENQ